MWRFSSLGRQLTGMGHNARLIPPQYVKPFVKRGKNDAARRGTLRAIQERINAVALFGPTSRKPSWPATVGPREQAGHMDASDAVPGAGEIRSCLRRLGLSLHEAESASASRPAS